MPKYYVQISELYQKIIPVEEGSKEEALIQAEKQYEDGAVFIDLAEDLTSLNFKVISEQVTGEDLYESSSDIAIGQEGGKV